MNLLYKEDFLSDSRVRDTARAICSNWHDGPRTPMGRLHFGSHRGGRSAEVPAVRVVAELESLLASGGKYVERDREALEEFAAYARKQAWREKYFAILKRAAAAAKAADMRYGDAYEHAINALSAGGLK